MSPFVKGALGFLGCAGICAAAYKIGKSVGHEEALKEVEMEEQRCMAAQTVVVREVPAAPQQTPVTTAIIPASEPQEIIPAEQPQTIVERVREKKMHGLRGTIFGGTSVIKDLMKNPDGKKLTLTVEDGDIVARISQKEGG